MRDIRVKRAFELPAAADGVRVLVDRLWPRGLSKAAAHFDATWKDLAPSDGLRRWFGHKPERFAEFRQRYQAELTEHRDVAKALLAELRTKRITLIYAAKDLQHNHAIVLCEFLKKIK